MNPENKVTQCSPETTGQRDLVSRLRWPEGISGPDDHPVSVKLRVEAADEIEKLRRNLRHWREECGKLHAKLAGAGGVAQAAPVQASQFWEALKQQCAASPDKSKMKVLIQVRCEDVVAAWNSLALPSTQENPPLVRRSEADAYFRILQTIARFPITDPKNMDAVNMRLIAEGALAMTSTPRQTGGEA